ncbi:MAG: hypothetical protein DI586_06670 [Micavibrio aeruginosavorus]|uniref:Uncharacterized protein n=1 Tax=Micavibrio aeruginosavorus TaxID=349221 RepID=A0A2W5FNS0_9BACT|nr:MAG: hypothetical protein DI586_06670 [Micavibrio aeruginosavorus]
MTIVISGFPGVGKSEFSRRISGCVDSDSSHFSWLLENGQKVKDLDGKDIRHPDFPNNYIKHIKSLINGGQTSIIFVSSHRDVRDALVKAEIPFVLVYPDRSLKDEYLARYSGRGSPEGFINLIKNNWDDFLIELKEQVGCEHVVLSAGQFMADTIEFEKSDAQPKPPSPF